MMDSKMNSNIEAATALFDIAASWVRTSQIKDLSKDDLLYRPGEKRSHIYWLLGHIVGSADIAPYIDGSDMVIDETYQEHFGIQSIPCDTAESYPSLAELLEMFEKALGNTRRAISNLKGEDLSKEPAVPLPEPLQPYFTTRYSVIAGFATHLSYHAGQISTILKMLGK